MAMNKQMLELERQRLLEASNQEAALREQLEHQAEIEQEKALQARLEQKRRRAKAKNDRRQELTSEKREP